MKLFYRLLVAWLLLGVTNAVWDTARGQTAGAQINSVAIKFVGPATVSEQFIRVNIRVKAGDLYRPSASQEDVRALYGTGQFYNIRVSLDQSTNNGVALTYIVQARPRVTEVKLDGNKKLQCTSCHDVHMSGNGENHLRWTYAYSPATSNDGSICRVCHQK